jgi:Na+-translocating ferredoxin:NAD+ oxidoreductase RnfD subunit
MSAISFKSIKVQINLFLALFTGFLCVKEHSLALLSVVFWTILFSILIEGSIFFFKTKKFQITASALTSGLILGLVLSPGSTWWIFPATAGLTIGLKHALRFHGKNLMNPAALGIFLCPAS